MVVCSLFDRKAGVYSPALSYPDTATAERAFVGLLSTGDSTPAQWPDDFALYSVGFFDPDSGLLTPINPPKCLLTGQSALCILDKLRQSRQGKGGAVGENGVSCSPEDSGASAERNDGAAASPELPGLQNPPSPADKE